MPIISLYKDGSHLWWPMKTFLFGRRNCRVAQDTLTQKYPSSDSDPTLTSCVRQLLSLCEPHCPYVYHKGKVFLLRLLGEAGMMKVFECIWHIRGYHYTIIILAPLGRKEIMSSSFS